MTSVDSEAIVVFICKIILFLNT